MSIAALNKVDPHAIADRHEDALAAAYQKVLRDAGRKAASRFRRLAPFATTAAAAEEPKQPNWAPPNIDELVDLDLIAKQTAKATRTLHTSVLAAVLDAYGDTVKSVSGVETGQPSFDVTNPSLIAMLDSFDARAGDVAKSVRDDLQKTIADAYQQGFSVDRTAKQIVAQSDQFSVAQARMLARTSLNGIANGGSHAAAQAAGANFKTWLATEDERTRETHSDADGQTVPIGQQFDVGGESCDYPGDPQLSDEEACNCRCTLTYSDSLAGSAFQFQPAADQAAPATLYIARHGMTAYDSDNQASDTIRGWADDPLTPEGLAEAHKLGAALQGLGISEIHTSDLIRAAETAHVIGKNLGVHPHKTGLLRPWDVGELQGQTSEAAADEIAGYVDTPSTEVPGGESFGEFAERFTAALGKAMVAVGAGETVLLVTHSHNLKFARDWFANGYEPPSGEQFAVAATPPASVLICEPAGDGWQVSEAEPQDPSGAVPAWAEYRPADDPEVSCVTCVFYAAGECEMFEAPVDPGMVCDEFQPAELVAATLGTTIGGEMASEPQITIPLNITIGQAQANALQERSASRLGGGLYVPIRPSAEGVDIDATTGGDFLLDDIRDAVGVGFYGIDGMPFQATGSTSLPLSDRNLAWDAGAARKSLQPADFPKAHFWKDPDGPADQIGSYKFPFAKRINGELTAVWKGVTSGAQRLSSAKGVDTGAIQKKMSAYYRKAASQYKDPTIKAPFAAVPGGEHEVDPMEVHAYLDDGGGDGSCAICGQAAGSKIHTTQIGNRDISAAAALSIGPTWRAVLCVEGEPTEDGRLLAPGSTTWRDLPLTLLCQTETAPGHDGAEVCGRIDRIWREGMNIMGEGVFDAGEFGLEAARLVSEQTLRGISVDLAVLEYEIQQIPAPDDSTILDIADGLDVPDATSERFVVTDGVIGAATICPFQAIANATIEVLTSSGPLTLRIARRMPAEGALTASAAGLAPARPPAAWFENPGLRAPTPITVTDDGRIFGHAALWGTCHIGHPGACVTPPRSPSGYRFFHLGAVNSSSGEIDVGTVTLGTGHASLRLGSDEALEHYDNTGTGAAHVRVGEDQHGIWVAGALHPGLSAERARTLKGAKLSGDWRQINGALELVGLLAVNVPGFPVPRPSARVASAGEEMERVALLAAGVPEADEFSPHRAQVLAAKARGGAEAIAELARA